jgi:hypothetical protein
MKFYKIGMVNKIIMKIITNFINKFNLFLFNIYIKVTKKLMNKTSETI